MSVRASFPCKACSGVKKKKHPQGPLSPSPTAQHRISFPRASPLQLAAGWVADPAHRQARQLLYHVLLQSVCNRTMRFFFYTEVWIFNQPVFVFLNASARAVHRLLENRHHGVPWPSTLRPVTQLTTAIIKRVNEASGLYQMFGVLADVVLLRE